MSEVRILVVDDDKFFSESLSKLLELEGYNVKTVFSGQEALEVLSESDQEMDLIISDIAMPGFDGLELKACINREESSNKVPFIFLTAYSDKKTSLQGTQIGADDVIAKPFDAEILLAKIENFLQKSKDVKKQTKEKVQAFSKEVLVNLTHEFKTPLVSITTGSELLIDPSFDVKSENAKRILHAIHRNGKRLESLVNDFVTLQNIMLGKAEREYQKNLREVEVKTLLSLFCEDMESTLSENNFILNHNIGVENLTMQLSPDCFLSALEELVDNARKFSNDGKEIIFNVSGERGKLVIEIFNKGRTVSKKNLSGVFMMFSQDERKKFEQQGLGMGLSIASHYIQLHGGTLELDNQANGGVVARVEVPIVA